MIRNATAPAAILEDQIDGKPMEPRIARIESDVSHLKSDVTEIKKDTREIRNDIVAIKLEQTAIRGELTTLNEKVDGGFAAQDQKIEARINALEIRMIRWAIGTALGCAGVAFSIARFVL